MEQNIQSTSVQNSSENVLVKKLGVILSVFVFLLPVFFVPVEAVGLYVAKITLLASGLVAIFAVFLSSILSKGVIEIPKVKYLIPIIIFAVVSLISSAFSGAIGASVAGSAFDLGTSGSIVMLVFSLFMTLVAVRSIGTVGKVVSAFIYSAAALAVYTLFAVFGGSLLPVSIASKLPLLLAGGVVDMAIVFGAATILSLCAFNMTEMSKKMRYILTAVMVFSILFIGAANFMPVVVILGVISLVFFVYILSWSVSGREFDATESGSTGRKISLSSLIVLVATVVLLLGGNGIGGYLSQIMRVQTTEIRPNFQATMNLTVASWQKNFALGIGPNRFVEFWAKNKSADINQSQFWNADFYAGSGFVPTIAITTGLLGLLSLLIFIGMYFLSGIKAIFAQASNSYSRYLATSSFLVSLYLWIILFLYTPGLTVLALAFIFTGLFTATLVPQGIIGIWRINIFSNPKTNFLSVLSIVVILIMSVVGGYFVWERAVASVIFQGGILDYQKSSNIANAKQSIAKAINISSQDMYWRGLTEIFLADLNRVLGGITNQNQMTDSVKSEIQILIANSVQSAKNAVEADRGNFQNWFALGRVYEILAQNGIAGSLESAKATYNETILRSPNNPSVPLALARLNVLEKDFDGAKTNITKSLELKNNYTDAYFTLAQIQAAQNDIPAAIKSVEATTVIEPNNSGLYFQLGLLKYNQKDFAGAIVAFERATALVSNYANAKYFLGLSYYQAKRNNEAIKQFEELNTSNPENQEVKTILANMKADKDLFSVIKPATANSKTPEKRSEPPIKQ